MTRLRDREFPHRLAIAAADETWQSADVASTDPVPGDGPFSGFLRREDAEGVRYAYFGGRTAWVQDSGRVTEGYLFEVSPDLRSAPRGYPSNGRTFRARGEAIATDSPELLPTLSKAYRS
ncbi:hypothetical protein [Microbacterium ulmi]|uniref:Uncharacterized protein n=1 Tax=Microbacterium ulmi TaxID=179095 RepID=A0A7Y2M2D4_9MICO|nr:hypothetical protein [Microbacterium ulmi]NII68825.1 hypothetical protein [Microbacterium ulmi]NNH04744.1 hypothetical protein [Microbacterium ulmi]